MTCECVDPGCPACKGKCTQKGGRLIYRVDMEDWTGTRMCPGCREDAMASGLFDSKPPKRGGGI